MGNRCALKFVTPAAFPATEEDHDRLFLATGTSENLAPLDILGQRRLASILRSTRKRTHLRERRKTEEQEDEVEDSSEAHWDPGQ